MARRTRLKLEDGERGGGGLCFESLKAQEDAEEAVKEKRFSIISKRGCSSNGAATSNTFYTSSE